MKLIIELSLVFTCVFNCAIAFASALHFLTMLFMEDG